MSEQRPRTVYRCTSYLEPARIMRSGEEELGCIEVVAAGGIVCEVWTNDNRDSGYVGEEASWTTVCRDRAMFDRIVGRSRYGIGHDVEVWLDGERV